MSLRKILETFIRFFSFLFQQKIRPHGRLYGRLCRTRAFCVQRLSYPGRNATCPLSSCSNKNDGSRGRFNCISTVSCKGSVCVEVLTSSYGRFFVEEGQFIKYTPCTSSLPRICLHSHTRRCSTTTDWLGCTIFAPLDFHLPIIIQEIPLQMQLESFFNDIFFYVLRGVNYVDTVDILT